MWELSQSHCCATCRFSRTPVCRMDNVNRLDNGLNVSESDLFPLLHDLACEHLQDSLEEECVQAVLVRPDKRCGAYECHLERYISTHGYAPREEENLYGLDDEYAPVPAMNARQGFGISLDF